MQGTTNNNASWLSSMFSSGNQGSVQTAAQATTTQTASTPQTATTQQQSTNWAGIANGAASVLSSVNTFAQGTAASRNSSYNAALLDQQAKTVALQTGSQTAQIRRQGAQALAGQSAAFAENGTGTGGSNSAIQRSTAIDTEMDAATADYNGRLQIADIENQAAAQRALAKSQRPGLVSLLGGISSAAGSYYNTSALTKR